LKRFFRYLGYLAALLLAFLAFVAITAWPNIGTLPKGEFLARNEQSPEWHGDQFQNPQPMFSNLRGGILQIFESKPGEEPDRPVPTVDSSAVYKTPPATGLRVTWFGHSSMLLEIDGVNVVVDPFWSERTSPFGWLGPKRWYPPPVPMDHLPRVDVVVISHDHYDHLDRASVQALYERGARFIVPLGIASHLVGWGIPNDRITQLDWWQEARVGALTIVSTPSRHASGRLSARSDQTLWTGYALVGPHHRVFYSGDTGLNDSFPDVGEKYGPFDVSFIEAGQYDAQWPDWHLGPEQAVLVHQEVRARTLIPVHWGLVKLAHHAWTEPPERILAAARCAHVDVLIPEPGQAVEPTTHPVVPRWWPAQPWSTREQTPIIASKDGEANHPYTVPACH
jgi:L-ascorbate metabolism protein UlaG (beta-lactamase superfamily)